MYFCYVALLADNRSRLIRLHRVCYHSKSTLECIGIYATDLISRQHSLDKNINRKKVEKSNGFTVKILKFWKLVTCQKNLDEQSSLIRVFWQRFHQNFSPENHYSIWEQKKKSGQNFKMFTIFEIPLISSLQVSNLCYPVAPRENNVYMEFEVTCQP